MRDRWFWNQLVRLLEINLHLVILLLSLAGILFGSLNAYAAGEAPQWMHAAANKPIPSYDDKTDAVQVYAETDVTVISADKIKTHVREAYKILKPTGREHGTVFAYLNSNRRITSLRGWCIPAQGKDYEVKDKEAVEVSPPDIPGAELISDVKLRLLRIPASDPGNLVGYEYEVEERPLVLQNTWDFQSTDPARESHYSLQLPSGWEYKASWLNYPEAKPVQSTPGHW